MTAVALGSAAVLFVLWLASRPRRVKHGTIDAASIYLGSPPAGYRRVVHRAQSGRLVIEERREGHA